MVKVNSCLRVCHIVKSLIRLVHQNKLQPSWALRRWHLHGMKFLRGQGAVADVFSSLQPNDHVFGA